MEDLIYKYFDEARRGEQKQMKWDFAVDQLIKIVCIATIVFAIVIIMLT